MLFNETSPLPYYALTDMRFRQHVERLPERRVNVTTACTEVLVYRTLGVLVQQSSVTLACARH